MTRKTEFRLLLDGRYAPTTSCIGFLEMPHTRAVEVFTTWHRDIHKPGGFADQEEHQRMQGAVRVVGTAVPRTPGSGPTIETHPVAGPLSHALEALPPLTAGANRRFLLVPTRSKWTAYFDNSLLGTDAAGPMGYLSRANKCRGLRIYAAADTLGTKSLYDKAKRGVYGASIFELYGPEQTDWLNMIRVVCAMNDGGRWRFEVSGTQQPYEEPETYKARLIRDKFPFALLDKYCRALGLQPFDDDFYLPPDQPNATLIALRYPAPPPTKEYTLAEVQAGVPWAS